MAIMEQLRENDMTIEELHDTLYRKYNVKFEFTKQLLTYYVRSLAMPIDVVKNSYKHNVTVYTIQLWGDNIGEKGED